MAHNEPDLQTAFSAKGLLALQYCPSSGQYPIAVSENQVANHICFVSACK
jgi:hypothetical protein